MADKKTSTGKKRASGRKGVVKKKYDCPNKGRTYSLESLVREMARNPALAKFIRRLLCAAHAGDNNAAECLRSYYKPSDSELKKLCIPTTERTSLLRSDCTVCRTDLFLLDVPAYVAAKARSRKR
jgi:hypothetical protein